MKPIAPLMIEHRNIEKILPLLDREQERLLQRGGIDREFLVLSMDFFEIYVDRYHHGKEEDVLFKALETKPLSDDLRRILNELLEEHARSRVVVRRLAEAGKGRGPELSPREIAEDLQKLMAWYPAHIEKEDRHFFLPVLNYLSSREQAWMVDELQRFDREFTNELYREKLRELDRIRPKAA